MADKYHSDTQEKVEVLSYTPDVQASGDLETATKTVNATSKQGVADYSASLTVPAPNDSRWLVKRVGVRLQLTIDSISAGHLYGSIYVNGVERKTFDLNGTGDKFVVQDLSEGQFNVGSADNFAVFLWVDAGQAVISVCQVWQAVGSTDTGYNLYFCLQLNHRGFTQIFAELNRIGTGNVEARLGQGGGCRPSTYYLSGGVNALFLPPTLLAWDFGIGMRVNTSGDLGGFWGTVKATVRNEA